MSRPVSAARTSVHQSITIGVAALASVVGFDAEASAMLYVDETAADKLGKKKIRIELAPEPAGPFFPLEDALTVGGKAGAYPLPLSIYPARAFRLVAEIDEPIQVSLTLKS